MWDRTAGGSGDDVAQFVARAPDEGYVVAPSQEAWLIKTGANGEGPTDLR
jgi:hypothetical protein